MANDYLTGICPITGVEQHVKAVYSDYIDNNVAHRSVREYRCDKANPAKYRECGKCPIAESY